MTLNDPSLLRTQGYIDGAWVDAEDGATLEVRNPVDDALLGTVPHMGRGETCQAIDAAHAAQPGWRSLTAKVRAAQLRDWFEQIQTNLEDLSVLITIEQGKPLAESRAEIAYGAAYIEWFAEEARRIYGETIAANRADQRIIVTREPVGVVAAITPWNFPNAMLARKLAAALAAGCTVVAKPSSRTPYSALALARLAEEAGLPKGVLNIVTGPGQEIGAELAAQPRVRKLSFTGSTRTGKLLMEQGAGTVKKLALELGGNAPFIVFDDADLDLAVAGAMQSKFRNAGQTCVCANRIFVQDGIHDAFVDQLTAAVQALKVGHGLEVDTDIGPLISQAAIEKVERHIDDALAKGAQLRCGGARHERGGNFFQPTVLTGVRPEMVVSSEETFGPLAPIYRFSTDEEVIRLANDTESGLASYFYTRDSRRIWKLAEALEYGMVGINTGFISTEVAPFGGIKESGTGREGSRHGIEEYLELKYLSLGDIT